MKLHNGKEIRRGLIVDFCISASILLLFGWCLISSAIKASTVSDFIIILLLAGAIVAVITHMISAIHSSLRWYEELLNTMPIPAVFMDTEMALCYENKAAAGTIQHELYKTHALFRKVPEGYAIAAPVACRMEHQGTEYSVTLTPVERRGLVHGYVIVFYNIKELLESYKSRTELLYEINQMLRMLNNTLSNFSNSTSALAKCTRQQAESLHTVVNIVNDAVAAKTVEQNNLQSLQDAISIISDCIKEGGEHARKISHVANDIAITSHSISNTVKIMKNIVQ